MYASASKAATVASTSPAASALVLADDVGLMDVGVGLQQRRAVGVSACQRPRAVVDAQLDDARVLVAVGHDGNRQLDATLVAIERQHPTSASVSERRG
jgi:hypothetical protein